MCCAALLCILLCLASCGTAPTTIANPAASTLDVAVTVLDHRNAGQTPGNTVNLAIKLSQAPQSRGSGAQIIHGSDAKTLVCDGNTQLQFSGSSYEGDVPAQIGQYTCTYFWQNGLHSAVLVIPPLLAFPLSIGDPANGATVAVPDSGDPGVTVSYGGPGTANAQVTAMASDFNNRTATSDAAPDRGAVSIPASQFPASFGIGWGTVTLKRTVTNAVISTLASNSAFHSVTVDSFEQMAVTPVRWL
jgi:hypothetical protein